MIDQYFIPENLIADKTRHHVSPSGRYTLTEERFRTKPGCWDYCRALVKKGETLIAEVRRNHPSFRFAFVEDHPDGHDYLVCAARYMGVTVVRLDTGERRDGEDEFTHCSWTPSPVDKTKLLVDGGFWGGPEAHAVVMDFRAPFALPWKRLSDADKGWSYGNRDYSRWRPDGTAVVVKVKELRKSDGVDIDELDGDEWLVAATGKTELQEREEVIWTPNN